MKCVIIKIKLVNFKSFFRVNILGRKAPLIGKRVYEVIMENKKKI